MESYVGYGLCTAIPLFQDEQVGDGGKKIYDVVVRKRRWSWLHGNYGERGAV